MSPNIRAAQSTVLLAALSSGSAAPPAGGSRNREALGDAVKSVGNVVCERDHRSHFLIAARCAGGNCGAINKVVQRRARLADGPRSAALRRASAAPRSIKRNQWIGFSCTFDGTFGVLEQTPSAGARPARSGALDRCLRPRADRRSRSDCCRADTKQPGQLSRSAQNANRAQATLRPWEFVR